MRLSNSLPCSLSVLCLILSAPASAQSEVESPWSIQLHGGYGAETILGRPATGGLALMAGAAISYQPRSDLALVLEADYLGSTGAVLAVAGLAYVVQLEGMGLRFGLRFGEHWSGTEGLRPAVSFTSEQRATIGRFFIMPGVAFDLHSAAASRLPGPLFAGYGGRAYLALGFAP